jgi:hypothetical protein
MANQPAHSGNAPAGGTYFGYHAQQPLSGDPVMLRSTFWLALALVITVGFATELRAQTAPLAIPPNLSLFSNYDENLATLSVTRTYTAEKPVTIEIINAAGIAEKSVVKVADYREEVLKYLLAETKIKTVDGKELDRKVAAKELKKGQPVILVSSALKLSAAYKGLFRDDAIILEVNGLGTNPDLDGVKPAKP